MKKYFKKMLFIALILSFNSVKSQDISAYKGKSKEELLAMSIESPSMEERIKIRCFLATNFPNTSEGETAKAWVDDKEGYSDKAKQHYLDVVKKYPDAWLAVINSYFSYTKENVNQGIADYEKMLSTDPSTISNPYAKKTFILLLDNGIRNYYFLISDVFGNKILAEEKLSYWEKKIGAEYFAFDFIRGIVAENQKNYTEAEKLYLSALKKKEGKDEMEVWTRLIDIQKDKLFDNENKNLNDQFSLFQPLIEEAKSRQSSSEIPNKTFVSSAFEFVGDYLAEYNYKMALKYYDESFKSYPTYTVLKKVHGLRIKNGETVQALLNDALEKEKILPTNNELQGYIGYRYKILNNPKSAEKYYESAISNSSLIKKKYEFSKSLISIYDGSYFNFSKSKDLLLSFIGRLPDDENIYYELYESRIKASEFTKAREYIQKAIELAKAKKADTKSYESELSAISAIINKETDLEKYYKENPFEKQWKDNYKDGLQLYVNFATNSSTIPISDYPKLKELAKQITDNGADEYSFKIAGHTDNAGTDIINNPLSVERAKSVVNYLYSNCNIPYVRIEYNGYGSKQPIADNATEAGKAKNRRVEISLSANIKKPRIVATKDLPVDWTRFSRDGNYFASGYFPLEIWDAKEKIHLRDVWTGYGSFTQRQFSPNSKYIAAIAGYGEAQYVLLIIDVNSGQIIQQQSLIWGDRNGYRIAWSPTSTELVVADNTGNVLLYDVTNNKKLKSYQTLNNIEVTYTNNGKYVCLLHGIKNGELEILDSKTFEKVVSKYDMLWPHAIGSNYNGDYLICSDDDRNLYVYNTDTWTYKKIKVSAWPQHMNISSHPGKNLVVLNDFGGGDHNSVEIVNIDNNTSVVKKDVGNIKYFWTYNDDGTKIYGYSPLIKHIDILDASTLVSLDKIEGATAKNISSFKDEPDNQLITIDQEGIHAWNVKTGTKNHYWSCFPVSVMKLPSQYEFIGLNEDQVNQKTVFTKYNSQDYSKIDLFSIPYKVEKWALQGDKIVIAAQPFTPANTGNSYGQILVYSFSNRSEIKSFSFFLPTKQLTYKNCGSGIHVADISPDGKYIALSTNWTDGFGREIKYSTSVRIFDLTTGSLFKEVPQDGSITNISFADNNKIIINASVFEFPGLKYIEQSTKSVNPVMKLSFPYEYPIEFSNLNLKINVSSDNSFSFYNLKTNELALTIISKRNNEWIAYTPSGEFATSINGTERVNWLLGDKRLPFSALKDKFENPALIKTTLGAIVQNVPANDVIIPVVKTVDPDIFVSPYKIEVITSKMITTKESEFEVKLKITKLVATLPDPKVVFELNGRKIGDKGFGVGEIVKQPTEISISKKINLEIGVNILRVFIEYKQAEVEVNSLKITRESAVNPSVVKSNSQLWFFGVGIAKYEMPSQNLDYADKDITEVADLLKKQEGVLYQKVNTKVLTNENATEKNVRIEMNEFLKMATAEDIIIIYISGHGVQDNDQNLFFVTYDADMSKPYTGMDISKVKSLIVNRPINQKALLLLDICHAGTVKSAMSTKGEQLSTDEAIKQLSEGTGSIVLASSTGKEKSFESSEFGGGHGAFSYAIILALKGDADKINGDSNGVVSLLEMQSFVSRKVVELTKGDQHPTTPQSSNLRDFPLYKY